MLKRAFLAIAATAALSCSLVSCTQDEKKVEEAVKGKNGKHDFTVDKDGNVNFKADIVYFKFDDYTLTQEGMARLDALADYLKSHQGTKLKVEGHCDDRGSIEYNL